MKNKEINKLSKDELKNKINSLKKHGKQGYGWGPR